MQTAGSDSRCILLLSDNWVSTADGICGVNQSIALALSRFQGVRVVCVIFQSPAQVSQADRKLADDNNITLISLSSSEDAVWELYTTFNENPVELASVITEQVPYASHIIGHSPVTAEAAIKLRESVYPDSKVILFYHVLPQDVDWLATELPYVVPTDSELVRLGELADVVYSVTEKTYWYYTAKFRNRCSLAIDHRLFLPQCTERIFALTKNASSENTVLCVTANAQACTAWAGTDIAACAMQKVLTQNTIASRFKISGFQISADKISDHIRPFFQGSVLDISQYVHPEDFYRDLANCALCIIPSRAEPFGFAGLHAISAGIPTLISADSYLASMIKRLTSDPEAFLVPVYPATEGVRQDGSVWRNKILEVFQNYQAAVDRATELRNALRRDEKTKETHDDVISFVLGGIRLTHDVTSIQFQLRKDADKEVPVTASFNRFLSMLMKQCWRYKHHPLTTESDLYQLLPGVDLPIQELVCSVIDKIEDQDRRIVAVDKTSGSLIVYCPNPDSLSDLWAMCDVINRAIKFTLFTGEENPCLDRFGLRSVALRTAVSGPEFLKYKMQLLC